MKYFITIGLAAIVIAAVLGCSESRFVEPEEPTFVVSGTVYSVYCPSWDPVVPYSEISDRPATITFESLDSNAIYTASTNIESHYSLNLPNGSYLVQTYSYHWRPWGRDTVNIPGDSVIDQTGYVGWYHHDTISVGFYYRTGDTLSQAVELDLISSLNELTGGYLDVANARRHIFDPADPDWSVIQTEYYIPISPELYPWDIEDRLETVMNADTVTYPTMMFAGMQPFACLFSSHAVDGDAVESEAGPISPGRKEIRVGG